MSCLEPMTMGGFESFWTALCYFFTAAHHPDSAWQLRMSLWEMNKNLPDWLGNFYDCILGQHTEACPFIIGSWWQEGVWWWPW